MCLASIVKTLDGSEPRESSFPPEMHAVIDSWAREHAPAAEGCAGKGGWPIRLEVKVGFRDGGWRVIRLMFSYPLFTDRTQTVQSGESETGVTAENLRTRLETWFEAIRNPRLN